METENWEKEAEKFDPLTQKVIESPLVEQNIKAPTVVEPKPLALSDGTYAPKDSKELSAMLSIMAKGGGFPKRFDTHEKRIAAYNLAASLMGPKWPLALNNICDIKGALVIYGELPSAIAERTGEVMEKRLYCIDKDYNEISLQNKNLNAEPWAGICEIQRKGRAKKEFYYTVEDAKNGGQLPATSPSPWIKFLKVMLMRKAQALAIKFEFSDAMVGAEIAEYVHDEAPDMKDVTQTGNKAAQLNERFS